LGFKRVARGSQAARNIQGSGGIALLGTSSGPLPHRPAYRPHTRRALCCNRDSVLLLGSRDQLAPISEFESTNHTAVFSPGYGLGHVAVAEDENGQIHRVAYGMACAMEESARCFGTPLPTAEEYHRLRRVADLADEIAEGRFTQICMNDSAEEKRIRQRAETIVKLEETRRFLPPRRTLRALPQKNQTAKVDQLSSRN
jgi:hypothetical protein